MNAIIARVVQERAEAVPEPRWPRADLDRRVLRDERPTRVLHVFANRADEGAADADTGPSMPFPALVRPYVRGLAWQPERIKRSP